MLIANTFSYLICSIERRSHTSLIESAAAYTSRPKLKYELDQVEVVTGEESERNVLQVSPAPPSIDMGSLVFR